MSLCKKCVSQSRHLRVNLSTTMASALLKFPAGPELQQQGLQLIESILGPIIPVVQPQCNLALLFVAEWETV